MEIASLLSSSFSWKIRHCWRLTIVIIVLFWIVMMGFVTILSLSHHAYRLSFDLDGKLSKGTNCTNGAVHLEKDNTPLICWNSKWSPICGHYFWNNDHGATKFCQQLGHNLGSFLHHISGSYSTDAFKIGECKKRDTWLNCSGGCNDYEIGGSCQNQKPVNCSAGHTIRIAISCIGEIQLDNRKEIQHLNHLLPPKSKAKPTNITNSKNTIKNSIISSNSSILKEKLGAFREINNNNRRENNPSSVLCKDSKLTDLSSSFEMTNNGWIFNTQENKPPDFSSQCGATTWYGWSHENLIGSVFVTFLGKGVGTIKFGNCAMEGFVLGLIGHKQLGLAHQNESISVTFNYDTGSTLVIQEFGSAIIKLHEMTLDCFE